MHKIYFIAGKSGAGKDTIARRVSEELGMPIVPIHTTRSPRDSDRETYYHSNSEILNLPCKELRGYQHVDSYVYYATTRCDIVDNCDYIAVGPSEMYVNFCSLFYDRLIVPIVLDVSLENRRKRCNKREQNGDTERRLYMDDKEWLDIFPEDSYVDGNRPLEEVISDIKDKILGVK